MARASKPKILGVGEAVRSISSLPQAVQMECRAALESSLKTIHRDAKSAVAVRSGRLRKSGKVKLSNKEFSGQVRFGSKGARHANLVEGGAKPHEVALSSKRTAKILTNRVQFFGRRVRHPGASAQPFLGPAFEREAPRFVKAVSRAVDKALKS